MSTTQSRFPLDPVSSGLIPLALLLVTGCASTEVAVSGMQSGGMRLTGGAGPAVFDSSTDEASEFSGDVDESDTALSLGFGYSFTDTWSVELEYTDFGELTYDGTWLGTSDSGTVESTGISAAIVGVMPLSETYSLIARAGVLSWDSEDNEVYAGTPSSSSDTGTDVFFGIGGQAALSPHFALRAEWDRWEIWDDNLDTFLIRALYFF